MIELFKIKYDVAPTIMDSVLNRRIICYNLQKFKAEGKRAGFYGLEIISHRTPQLWTFLPEDFKQCVFFKAMSGNGYVMSVPADCAKYLYQTKTRVYLRYSSLVLDIYHGLF